YLADPAHPDREPVAHRYPAAGTANADVQLWHATLGGARSRIGWDAQAFPYLASMHWTDGGAALQLLSRDQKRGEIRRVEIGAAADHPGANCPGAGSTVLATQQDPSWVDVVPGLPAIGPSGTLFTRENH